MARAEHGAKSMGGEAECYRHPVCFCVLACVLASPTYFPFTAIFCVVLTNMNTPMCVLSNLKTVVPSSASHAAEEKWFVYVQCFGWKTAAVINLRDTFPNFESMRAHGEYM